MSYLKARFSHPTNGATAGLVFNKADFDALSIEDLSRRWPMREATKMALLELSPVFEKAADAFGFMFDEPSWEWVESTLPEIVDKYGMADSDYYPPDHVVLDWLRTHTPVTTEDDEVYRYRAFKLRMR
jgi:hypothetical protein